MFSRIPIRLKKQSQEDIDEEILKRAIIAKLDAVNLYEQMAASTENKDIKTVLLHIVREEKIHVEQFQALRNRLLLHAKDARRPLTSEME